MTRSALAVLLLMLAHLRSPGAEPWPGTARLEQGGDLGMAVVRGIDAHLDGVYRELPGRRDRLWRDELAGKSGPVWEQASEAWRARLRDWLGVVDARGPVGVRLQAPLVPGDRSGEAGVVGQGNGYRIRAVEWDVFRGVKGEGLLLEPEGPVRADVIAVPDCDWTPEQLAGLDPGVPGEWQFARVLVAAGCRVLVPALIDRGSQFAGNPGVRSTRHSQRETLWRAAYEMGRHPLGYELQRVLAAADWLGTTRPSAEANRPLGLIGYGEGGLLALYGGAMDTRFSTVGVSGAFGLGSRQPDLPLYRNVWSVLERFGDAELAALIQPRRLVVEHGAYPTVQHTDAGGGAPGRLGRPGEVDVAAEESRWRALAPAVNARVLREEPGLLVGPSMRREFLRGLGLASADVRDAAMPERKGPETSPMERTRRLYLQVLEDTQHLMRESEYTRREFWKGADFRSQDGFVASQPRYREQFRTNVVGLLPPASVPANPRSRLLYETNGIRGYEVVLGVYPEVLAYGILVLPTGIQPGERRPVVVCQHGLEGRPTDVADPRVQNDAYHRYAYRLAERGFITFAPQNAYLGRTEFRQVLRKAQPAGLTLWSYIVRQHEVITEWLAGLPQVNPQRIAFYGLSYGGKSAMRIPVWVDRYCLSICSADYNEWIWKNVSNRSPYSYLWTSEYDMPEWNLGNTFNYAELSWLIFPRPFMVERGHDDGVAPDEWVAYEYARTRRHYVKLGLADRTEIEFFNGPHTIHGVGTFRFLHRHLQWPEPR